MPFIGKIDSLSLQSMARLLKAPKLEKFDDDCAKICWYDEGKSMEDSRSRDIELGCGPLPKGWEQCLDLKTGELYYIDRSCSKRTNRDPRPILKKVDKDIDARISSIWGNAKAKDSDSECKQLSKIEECAVQIFSFSRTP